MGNTLKLLAAPAYLAATSENVYVPSSALLFGVVRHIHVANVTNAAATFSLFIGATGAEAAGTQLTSVLSVAAYGTWDYYGALKLSSAQFLVGVCETGASKLTISVEGEEGVV